MFSVGDNFIYELHLIIKDIIRKLKNYNNSLNAYTDENSQKIIKVKESIDDLYKRCSDIDLKFEAFSEEDAENSQKIIKVKESIDDLYKRCSDIDLKFEALGEEDAENSQKIIKVKESIDEIINSCDSINDSVKNINYGDDINIIKQDIAFIKTQLEEFKLANNFNSTKDNFMFFDKKENIEINPDSLDEMEDINLDKNLDNLYEIVLPSSIINNVKYLNPREYYVGKSIRLCIFSLNIYSPYDLSDKISPKYYVKLYNKLFNYILFCIYENDGIVNSYSGDSFVISFGLFHKDFNDVPGIVIDCISALYKKISFINEYLSNKGLGKFDIAIGVNVGNVIFGGVGEFGPNSYFIMGDNVQLTQALSHYSAFNSFLTLFSKEFVDLSAQKNNFLKLRDINLYGRNRTIYYIKKF